MFSLGCKRANIHNLLFYPHLISDEYKQLSSEALEAARICRNNQARTLSISVSVPTPSVTPYQNKCCPNIRSMAEAFVRLSVLSDDGHCRAFWGCRTLGTAVITSPQPLAPIFTSLRRVVILMPPVPSPQRQLRLSIGTRSSGTAPTSYAYPPPVDPVVCVKESLTLFTQPPFSQKAW